MKLYNTNRVLNEYITRKINFLKDKKDIIDLKITSDVEQDYESFSLAGVMIKSNQYLYPVGAGFDIGCGLGVFKTGLTIMQIEDLKKLFDSQRAFRIRRKRYTPPWETNTAAYKRGMLGEIETGNHFIELRVVNKKFTNDNIFLQQTSENEVFILIHSGIPSQLKLYFASRFIELFKKYNGKIKETDDNGYTLVVPKDDKDADEFIEAVKIANDFATENRFYIANQLARKLGGECLTALDASHSIIKRDEENNIIHYNGIQELCYGFGNQSALVLSGASNDNYIVTSKGNSKYINHGTTLKHVNEEGNRIYSTFEEMIEEPEFNNSIHPLLSMKPLCGCKRGEFGYDYKIY